MKPIFCLLLVLLSYTFIQAQIPPKYAVKEALKEAKLMKEEGVIVIRLESAHAKIKMLKRALTKTDLKKRKRKRLQGMLDETILRKSERVENPSRTFIDIIPRKIWILLIVFVVVVIALTFGYKGFLITTFDPFYAVSVGISTGSKLP